MSTLHLLKSISLVGALALAVISFSAPAGAQTLPGASMVTSIDALKESRLKVEASMKAKDAAALSADMAALKAASQKLRSEVALVKSGLAPERRAVESARRAFGEAERGLRAARVSRDTGKITAAQKGLLAAFDNLVTAQDALIAGTAALGLPAPTAQLAAVKTAREARVQANIQLGIARTSKDAGKTALAEQALAETFAALANAQEQLMARQPAASSQAYLIEQAERLLLTAGNVAARLRAGRDA